MKYYLLFLIFLNLLHSFRIQKILLTKQRIRLDLYIYLLQLIIVMALFTNMDWGNNYVLTSNQKIFSSILHSVGLIWPLILSIQIIRILTFKSIYKKILVANIITYLIILVSTFIFIHPLDPIEIFGIKFETSIGFIKYGITYSETQRHDIPWYHLPQMLVVTVLLWRGQYNK